MVIKARLPTKKKLGLIAMFMGGILTTIAGILRCALIITAGSNGARQAGSWSVRESFIAVCVTNVPMIYPFFQSLPTQQPPPPSSEGNFASVFKEEKALAVFDPSDHGIRE
ncbi:hypothetical protein ACLMJK_004285 [Lecanora helva]